MSKRHTAANISDRLSEIIKEWGIQVFCMGHDNASNMNLVMELCELFPNDLGCTGHTLQLAIKSGLVLPNVIDAARRVVSHFRHLCLEDTAGTTWHKSKKNPKMTVEFHIRNVATAVQAKDRGAVCARIWNGNQAIHPKVTRHESITVEAAGTADSSSTTFDQGHRINVWWVVGLMCVINVGLSFIFPVLFNLTSATICIWFDSCTCL